jgi:OmcA/MtrC family decaheme c-type cytochrome
MQLKTDWTMAVRVILAALLLTGTVALVSAPNSPYKSNEKAALADEKELNYVRPGLVTKLLSAEIANDGTIKAKVKFTDPAGVPLDRLGVETPGVISASFIAAYIPKGQQQYTSYTTRVQTSPITGKSAVQAGADTGGRWVQTAPGEYDYTFGTKAPSGWDKSVTHTVGVYSNRNLDEFEYGRPLDDDVFAWVPDGSSKPAHRDVVATKSCQKCHIDTFAFHGTTGRSSMDTCVLCHTPQTTDPDTGNTVDMPVMTHKIHMGQDLPSVVAGGKYVIIGNQQSVHDYSHVAIPTDKRNCTVCHEEGPAQAGNWLSHPNRAACGACHDNVNFATGEGHVNLPQPNDNQCAQCHVPQGELEFDASILGAHTIPQNSKMLTGIRWSIDRVDNGSAGRRPTITFTIKDKNGNPLTLASFNRLFAVMGGPTTDYITKFAGQTTNGYVSEDLARATGGNGVYTYTFNTEIPANAKGTFSIALDGRRVERIYDGTVVQQDVQYGAKNAIIFFSVDGSAVVPRREIVKIEKCNACHVSVRLHGNNRWDNIEHCASCHNPVETDAARRPAAQLPPQSVDFRQMIHNIHGGEDIKMYYGVEDYIVYGFGSNPINFSHVVYPGRLATCTGCHVNNSQYLPGPSSRSVVADPRGYLNPVGPQAASCLSCHRSKDAASHALANTTTLGESCGACHGDGKEFSVQNAHAAVTSPAPR